MSMGWTMICRDLARSLAAFCAFVLCAAGASPVLAQESGEVLVTEAAEEAEDPKRWSNEAEFSYVKTGGNSSASTLALSNRFAYNFTYAELLVGFGFLRASSATTTLSNVGGEVVEDTITTTGAERYEVTASYRQNTLGNLFWYGGGGWFRNKFSGINSRFNVGGGGGYRFVESDTSLFVGELGLGITGESLTVGTSETFVDLRAAIEGRFKLTDSTDFDILVEAFDNVQNTRNLRVKLDTAVTVAMSGTLALRVGYLLDYRNEPVVQVIDVNPDEPPATYTFSKTDSTLSVSLVVKF
jgi:putative salt-induced outer membrane protein YdiY